MYKLYLRSAVAALALVSLSLPLSAHVTPNVSLVKRGDFVKQTLPGATKFFEKSLDSAAAESVRQATGWTPQADESKVYVGRNDAGKLVGSVVFLWVPSQHGPVGIGVAFDSEGKIVEATVTDVGTEPLVWVRPLLRDGTVRGVQGLPLSSAPDTARVAGGVSGAMSRYYAQIIAQGVSHAQAMAKAAALAPGSSP